MERRKLVMKTWTRVTRIFPIICFLVTLIIFIQNLHLQFRYSSKDTVPVSLIAMPNSTTAKFQIFMRTPTHRPENLTDFFESVAPRLLENFPGCRRENAQLWSKMPELFHNSKPKCHRLFNSIDNETESEFISSNFTEWSPAEPHSDSSMLDMVKNCTEFLHTVEFAKDPGSKEEADFPLAYVFVAHRNSAQTVRLFRMLYQPQNVYCVTYDAKSHEEYRNVVIALSTCFPSNVHLTPNPEPIHYFGYSILHSVMECMKLLATSSVKWRYVQVVSWNDFPLRTNWEMVKIFKILNGSQDSELMQMNTPEHFTYKFGQNNGQFRSIPPGGLKMYKGSFATSMTREFINFIFKNPTAVRFYEWLHDAKAPEEFYWPTLVHNLQLNPPGGFPGECEAYYSSGGSKKPFLSRFQVWIWENGKKQCKGVHVNWSCVYGIKDLPMLIERPELIAHKLYEEYQPALLYCLEEWYWKRTCAGDTGLITSYYENLPSAKFQRLPDREKEKYVCNT